MGDEWVRDSGLGFTNPLGTGEVWHICLYFSCGCVGSVGGSG